MTGEMFPEVTVEDKLVCVKRELALRRTVYPRWQEEGKITAKKADWELRVMEAIVADYERPT